MRVRLHTKVPRYVIDVGPDLYHRYAAGGCTREDEIALGLLDRSDVFLEIQESTANGDAATLCLSIYRFTPNFKLPSTVRTVVWAGTTPYVTSVGARHPIQPE